MGDVSQDLNDVVWLVNLQGVILAGIILVVSFCSRSVLTAKWRSLLWGLVFLRLAIPVSLPSSISIQNAFQSGRQTATLSATVPADTTTLTPPDDSVVASVTDTQQSQAVLRETWQWSGRSIALSVWLIVSVGLLLHLLRASISLLMQLRRMPVLQDARVLQIARQCAAEAGVKRIPEIRAAVDCGPAVAGWVKPVLLLSRNSVEELSDQQLRFVLLHEFHHLRTCDTLVAWLQHFVKAFYWFNPAVWIAHGHWRSERELACDRWVLDQLPNDEHRLYAETILSLSESTQPSQSLLLAASMVHIPSLLERRIRAMRKQQRGSFTTAVTGLLCVLSMVTVGLTDRVQATDESTKAIAAVEQENRLTQSWCVTFEEDTVVITAASETEAHFIQATIKALQKINVEKFTLRSPETRNSLKVDCPSIDIRLRNGEAMLSVTANVPEEHVNAMRAMLGENGVQTIKFAARNEKVRMKQPERQPRIVFAKHTIIWEGTEALTEEQTVARLAEWRRAGKVRPKVYMTNGFAAASKVPDIQVTSAMEVIGQDQWSVMSFVQGIRNEKFDSVRTQADLDRSSGAVVRGRVLLPSGELAAGTQLVLLPKGRWGNLNFNGRTFVDPISEKCWDTQADGSFELHVDAELYYVAMVHRDGYLVTEGPLTDGADHTLMAWQTITVTTTGWTEDQQAEIWVRVDGTSEPCPGWSMKWIKRKDQTVEVKVPVGTGKIAQILNAGGVSAFAGNITFDIQPGQKQTITIPPLTERQRAAGKAKAAEWRLKG